MQETQLGSKANLLESCFGGWIIHVWGLPVAFGGSAPQASFVLTPDLRRTYWDDDEIQKILFCLRGHINLEKMQMHTVQHGTGFTQFYLPPTRLSTNGMSHPACIS